MLTNGINPDAKLCDVDSHCSEGLRLFWGDVRRRQFFVYGLSQQPGNCRTSLQHSLEEHGCLVLRGTHLHSDVLPFGVGELCTLLPQDVVTERGELQNE